jgi:hypothetical protein
MLVQKGTGTRVFSATAQPRLNAAKRQHRQIAGNPPEGGEREVTGPAFGPAWTTRSGLRVPVAHPKARQVRFRRPGIPPRGRRRVRGEPNRRPDLQGVLGCGLLRSWGAVQTGPKKNN